MKTAVFAGSFDPITIGHEELVRRAAGMFDKIVVAVGINSQKNSRFPLEQRIDWIKKTFADMDKVEVCSYDGLTVDFCHQVEACCMVRGVRNAIDLAYEQQVADLNRRLAPDIETVMLFPRPEVADISSTAVREMLRYGKSVEGLVPKCVVSEVQNQ